VLALTALGVNLVRMFLAKTNEKVARVLPPLAMAGRLADSNRINTAQRVEDSWRHFNPSSSARFKKQERQLPPLYHHGSVGVQVLAGGCRRRVSKRLDVSSS